MLFESIAYRLGYERLERALPVSVHPLVLWAGLFVFLDVVVLQGYKELQGYTATFVETPTWLVQPGFALLAAVAVVYLHERYEEVLREIDVANRTSDPDRFADLAPYRLTVGLYLVAVGYRVWRVVFDVGVVEILRIGGVSELVGLAFVSFAYSVIFAEFATTYLGLLVLLPREIRRSDFRLDFLDPEGVGGLRPVGELAKTAYYFVLVGLVAYLVVTYGPFFLGQYVQTDYPRPGVVTNASFTAAWLVAIGTMAYGFAQLHLFMKREKRAELTRLNRRSQELVENRFDVEKFEITDEAKFDDLRRRMEYVNATREYPTTFAMGSQLLFSLVLPKGVQLLLDAL